jgi:LysR family hydrogen peroxide-inducible transcriptional activator
LSKLEEHLGFLLFDRFTKPFVPTVSGKTFLIEAERMMIQFYQLNDFSKGLETKRKGDLIVGVIPTISSFLISLFAHDFREKHPQVNLTIIERKTELILEGLLDRTLHAGIVATPISSTMKYQKISLFYEKFQIYFSDNHHFYSQDEISIQQPSYDDLWILNEGNCFSNQVISVCKLDIRYKDNLEYLCDSIDSLCRIVDYSGGFTFISELATINLPREKEANVKEISGKEKVREISIIHLKNEPNLQLIKLIGHSIKNNLPKRMLDKTNKKVIPTSINL